MNYSFTDFYSVATMRAEPGYGHEWERCSALEIETTIYLINEDRKGIEDDTKVGTMKLIKISKEADIASILDNISGDEAIVGVAIDGVLNGDSNGQPELFDDDVMCAGDPFVVTRFDVEPEFKGKRLGHTILHIALQGSGCEGHSIFFLPSKAKSDSGIEFLTKFYLDGEKRSYVVKGTKVVCYNYYNSGGSVRKKREEMGKEC